MNIQDISLCLFDRKTVMVLFDKASKITIGKYKLLDKTTNPATVKYVELTCPNTAVLTVSESASLPSGYGLSKTYEFNYSSPSQSTGHDVFFTDAPTSHIVIGVGDIRDLAPNKTAMLHKFKLLNGIVISSPAENRITIYYKLDSDLETPQTV